MGIVSLSVEVFLAIITMVFGAGVGSGAAVLALVNGQGITLCYMHNLIINAIRVKHQYSATIYIRTQLLVTYEEYLNT